MSKRTAFLALLLLVSVFFAAISTASWINRDHGGLGLMKVSIPADGYNLKGLLYVPREAHPDNPRPAIIVTHGISNTKEAVSCLALELAREGFVALALDLAGHGESGGTLSVGDPSFGVSAALEYLRSLDYVDRGLIGLVGHSLGAGAVRRVADAFGVEAVVFIGGGIGEMSEGGAYGTLSPTFPRNLLVVVGEHDILFDIDELEIALRPVFNTQDTIIPGEFYGDFQDGTSRKLVTPPTIHLLEPVDPTTVRETIFWMIHTMKPWSSVPPKSPIYVDRDLMVLIALAALIGMVFPLSHMSREFLRPRPDRDSEENLGVWHVLLGWSSLGLALFFPMMLVGTVIPFPPLIFGSSMAWWLLVSSLAGLLVLWLLKRRMGQSLSLGDSIGEFRDVRDIAVGVGVFLLMYLIVWLGETQTVMNLTIIVPIFKGFASTRRLAAFPAFVPFYLPYFFTEGLYLHRFQNGHHTGIRQLLKALGLKACPYLVLLLLQYGGMYFIGVRLLPGFLGFFVEFLWATLPLFAIAVIISCWLYMATARITTGTILNTLLFAWISATLFPFGSFS